MREIVIRLDDARRREFRRFLTASAALHLTVFFFLAWTPGLPTVTPPAAISVQLVAAPASVRATPAPPKPRPKPPKPAPVVLPTEPAAPKPQAKPQPKPEPPKAEPAPEPEPEQAYEDVLAQLREEVGEPATESAEPVEAAAATPGSGAGLPVPPEVAAWMREARIHIRRSWVVPDAFELQRLVAHVQVELDAAGNVRGTPSVTRRSGNPWYDDGVVSSILKATPLPAPPEAGSWTFVFYSDRES